MINKSKIMEKLESLNRFVDRIIITMFTLFGIFFLLTGNEILGFIDISTALLIQEIRSLKGN